MIISATKKRCVRIVESAIIWKSNIALAKFSTIQESIDISVRKHCSTCRNSNISCCLRTQTVHRKSMCTGGFQDALEESYSGNIVTKNVSDFQSDIPEMFSGSYVSKSPIFVRKIFKEVEPLARKSKSQKGEGAQCEEILQELFNLYKTKGALKAEDALEQVLRENAGGSRECRTVLNLFQYILRSELGFEHREDPVLTRKFRGPLAGAVVLQAMQLSNGGNERSKLKTAQKMISFNKLHPDVLPKSWVDEATKFEAVVTTRASTAKPNPLSEKSNTFEEEVKSIFSEHSKAPMVLKDLVGMVGQKNVKDTFVMIYNRFQLAEKQRDEKAFTYNAILEGNPGTGRGLTARSYAAFLQQLKILQEGSTFLEISGSRLSLEGLNFFKGELDKLNSRFGGIVLIENAPKLLSSIEGRRVLLYLISMARQKKTDHGDIIWLLFGLTKDMQTLMTENIETRSFFPLKFSFDDFNDNELTAIFQSLMDRSFGSLQKKDRHRSGTEGPAVLDLPVPSLNAIIESKKKDKRDCEDNFGRKWTSNGTFWENDVNGISRLHPSTVGTPENPLLFDGQLWFWNASTELWRSNQDEELMQYPGIEHNADNLKTLARFRCENEKHLRIAIRRIGRQRCRPDFDNARAIVKYFEQVRARQANRIKKERRVQGQSSDIFVFTREDLLGPQVTYEALTRSPAYRELQKMEGLSAVKQSVEALIKLAVDNARREEEEKPPLDIVVNRLFLGNPGTGKTTVAKIYAQMLTEMGLLSKGEVLFKCASDFLGEAVGMSEQKTKDLLASAQGSVLVIDEAYSFYAGDGVNKNNDNYRKAVIDTIVEQVSAKPGDDRAVLLLGYRNEMELMLKNMNPGLTRRFQLENAFSFEDYDDEALLRILLTQAKRASLHIDFSVAKRAISSLALARARPHFGNAGTLENMLSEAKLRMAPGADKLTLADFGLNEEPTQLALLNGLYDDLVGCQSIKTKMQVLKDTVLFAQSRGDDARSLACYNYLFTGSPGTGKTTVARRMGKAFKALGLLPDASVHEVSASDLVTGYVGQAGKKTRETLERSLGGVLFIDEAYQLDPQRGGQFMSEAVDELVKCLTMPEFQGKVLVILAGYGADMEQMLQVNQGLRSRFSERLEFEDMVPGDAAELMARRMAEKRLPVPAADRSRLLALSQRLVSSEGFSNGRDIETWSTLAYQQVARGGALRGHSIPVRSSKRVAGEAPIEDIEKALDALLASRIVKNKQNRATVALPGAGRTETASAFLKPVTLTTRSVEKEALPEKTEQQNEAQAAPGDVDSSNFFAHMDNNVLQAIQDALAKQGIKSMKEVSAAAAALGADHPVVKEVVRHLAASGAAGSERQGRELFAEWQQAHLRTQKEVAARAKAKGNRLQPIWRCAACGMGGQPYIVCSVAPYIERFERVPEE